MNFYISLFKQSSVINIEHYGVEENEPEGTVKMYHILTRWTGIHGT